MRLQCCQRTELTHFLGRHQIYFAMTPVGEIWPWWTWPHQISVVGLASQVGEVPLGSLILCSSGLEPDRD